jgi:hypothetical protein
MSSETFSSDQLQIQLAKPHQIQLNFSLLISQFSTGGAVGGALNIFLYLKGQCHEIFDPQFFSSINTPEPPDSWAKAVSNINLYSRRYSIFSVSYPKLFYFILHTIGREGPLWMVFC